MRMGEKPWMGKGMGGQPGAWNSWRGGVWNSEGKGDLGGGYRPGGGQRGMGKGSGKGAPSVAPAVVFDWGTPPHGVERVAAGPGGCR